MVQLVEWGGSSSAGIQKELGSDVSHVLRRTEPHADVRGLLVNVLLCLCRI